MEPAPFLASTAFLETTLILFPRIPGVMATMAGVPGRLVLCGKARSAADLGEPRTTVPLIGLFNRAVL